MLTIREGIIGDLEQLNQPWAWGEAMWEREDL